MPIEYLYCLSIDNEYIYTHMYACIYIMNIYVHTCMHVYIYSFSSIAELKFCWLINMASESNVYKQVIKSIFLLAELRKCYPCFKYLSNAAAIFCVLITVVIFMKKG